MSAGYGISFECCCWLDTGLGEHLCSAVVSESSKLVRRGIGDRSVSRCVSKAALLLSVLLFLDILGARRYRIVYKHVNVSSEVL